MSNSLTIDPQVIETLRSLDPEAGDHFLRDIVTLYITDTGSKLQELELAIKEGKMDEITRLAHSIKGSAANLGAVTVRSLSGQIEQRARTGQSRELPMLFNYLGEAFLEAQSALEKII